MVPVVSEIGVNWNGHLGSAIDLIGMAKRAGATIAKFQHQTPELAVPKSEWNKPRVPPWGGDEIPYIEYKKAMRFGHTQWQDLKHFSVLLDIPIATSVWDIVALEDFKLQEIEAPFIKVCSAKLTDDDLLKACVESGSPVLLSCGMSTEAEVDHAVEIVGQSAGASLLHCHSAYPVTNESEANLSLIPRMKERYGLPVGFSSHFVSPYVALAAVSRYGADIVECHITTDRANPGSDHAASLEFPGLQLLVRELERLDHLGGDGERRVWASERPSLSKLRGM